MNPRKSCKKLYIRVDDSNIIQWVELIERSVFDYTVVPDLLDQVEGQGDSCIADRVYDTKKVYEEVAKQNQNAKIVSNPRGKKQDPTNVIQKEIIL